MAKWVTHWIVIDVLQNVVAYEVVDVAFLRLNDECRCDRSSRISTNHGRVQEVLACREDAVEMVIVTDEQRNLTFPAATTIGAAHKPME
jgi:hypothetical protein